MLRAALDRKFSGSVVRMSKSQTEMQKKKKTPKVTNYLTVLFVNLSVPQLVKNSSHITELRIVSQSMLPTCRRFRKNAKSDY